MWKFSPPIKGDMMDRISFIALLAFLHFTPERNHDPLITWHARNW